MSTKNVKMSSNFSDLNFFQKISFRIKRSIRRSIIKSKKNMLKDDYILRGEYEKETIDICKNAINNPNSVLLISPKSGKRYINNTVEQIYVIIMDKTVDVINHTYHYSEPICTKTHSIITNMFDGNVENRRNEMEDDIRSNITHSLKTISDKLKSKNV